jgi:hypothetical protein
MPRFAVEVRRAAFFTDRFARFGADRFVPRVFFVAMDPSEG